MALISYKFIENFERRFFVVVTMASKNLASEIILTEEQRKNRINITKEFKRVEGANYWAIEGRNFKQYHVNPTPDDGMHSFPDKSEYAIISTEIHAYNIVYRKDFR